MTLSETIIIILCILVSAGLVVGEMLLTNGMLSSVIASISASFLVIPGIILGRKK